MRNGLNVALALGLGVTVLQWATAAEDKAATPATPRPAPTNAPAAAPKLSPEEQKQNMSYAIGMNIGNSIKRGLVELDVDAMAGAIKDVLAGRTTKITEPQAQEAMRTYQVEARAKHDQMQRETAEKNKKEGAAFLAENKTKPGVKTRSVTLPDGTTAELQYKVITEGTGAMPKTNETVTVNYRGTLIDGKEFDNSAKRGQPGKFPVTGVVRGWTEALEMMKVGSKWELYLPPTLAYGDAGRPGIDPGSTLIFEMELVGIDSPQPPPPPAQPLTSDIIRVPSAEELKKGAKIEVIKAEDLEKYTNSAAKKAAEPEKK
jgi:FKBP-type peptidyl-prolyl cis-trans isomerase FklB